MKRPLIWKCLKNDFYILWVWRVSFIFTNKVEDKRKFGTWINPYSFLIFLKNYGIGVGHSIGCDNVAYEYKK